MNRREFLQVTAVVTSTLALMKKPFSLTAKGATKGVSPEYGLPACLPFCLAPSPPRKVYTTYLPFVNNSSGEDTTISRKKLIRFWERND